jgi:hypothetical protein
MIGKRVNTKLFVLAMKYRETANVALNAWETDRSGKIETSLIARMWKASSVGEKGNQRW